MDLFPWQSDQPEPWDKFVEWARKPADQRERWVFRGVLGRLGGGADGIESSFDRACKVLRIPSDDRVKAEQRLLRDFQRHPEGHDLGLDLDDYLGWFALMAHHGAPTRVLDWTYSPFVAAFFAVEKSYDSRQWASAAAGKGKAAPAVAGEGGSQGARSVPVVWALDAVRLTQRLQQVLDREDWALLKEKKKCACFRKLFVERSPAKAFVSTATPLRLNERLSVQQGLFLCPGDVSRTWQENLEAIADSDDGWRKAFAIRAEDMETAFTELRRMNISRRSLFPGLDGYAGSMAHRVKFLLELPISGD